MSKHTRGEWKRDDAFVYALNENGTNRFWAAVNAGRTSLGDPTSHEEVVDNAKLFAAAPAMYDELKRLRDSLREYCQDSSAIVYVKASSDFHSIDAILAQIDGKDGAK